ncbi:hypothetical protein NEIELOOT_02431 [Neisseria elongata subsp. glycolytica ATCC 29315]|uniref:Uncharacterized protein n=1 Tax=Neisseria elongata subsp. glycolytica ATCC 29315 TaxID=546263 RepID=D4DTM5_NEIEG|nr:hypothetical protein NEIELOOT_02431 [Neisseria elongata subsp. glycolytica ATCC 29315]
MRTWLFGVLNRLLSMITGRMKTLFGFQTAFISASNNRFKNGEQ